MSCSRCLYIAEQIQNILNSVPVIGKNDIRGICDNCRIKPRALSCKRCKESVKRFVLNLRLNMCIEKVQSLQQERYLRKLEERFYIKRTKSHSDVCLGIKRSPKAHRYGSIHDVRKNYHSAILGKTYDFEEPYVSSIRNIGKLKDLENHDIFFQSGYKKEPMHGLDTSVLLKDISEGSKHKEVKREVVPHNQPRIEIQPKSNGHVIKKMEGETITGNQNHKAARKEEKYKNIHVEIENKKSDKVAHDLGSNKHDQKYKSVGKEKEVSKANKNVDDKISKADKGRQDLTEKNKRDQSYKPARIEKKIKEVIVEDENKKSNTSKGKRDLEKYEPDKEFESPRKVNKVIDVVIKDDSKKYKANKGKSNSETDEIYESPRKGKIIKKVIVEDANKKSNAGKTSGDLEKYNNRRNKSLSEKAVRQKDELPKIKQDRKTNKIESSGDAFPISSSDKHAKQTHEIENNEKWNEARNKKKEKVIEANCVNFLVKDYLQKDRKQRHEKKDTGKHNFIHYDDVEKNYVAGSKKEEFLKGVFKNKKETLQSLKVKRDKRQNDKDSSTFKKRGKQICFFNNHSKTINPQTNILISSGKNNKINIKSSGKLFVNVSDKTNKAKDIKLLKIFLNKELNGLNSTLEETLNKKRRQPYKITSEMINALPIVSNHLRHNIDTPDCLICDDSDINLNLEEWKNKNRVNPTEFNKYIKGKRIFRSKSPEIFSKSADHEPISQREKIPILYKSVFTIKSEEITEDTEDMTEDTQDDDSKGTKNKKVPAVGKGTIRYALSDRRFIEKGWTVLPVEKVVYKEFTYGIRPAHPEFDWFKHNKNKGVMQYDTGEKLADFNDNGRGRWYYKNGKIALDYYDSEELNGKQRIVIYSSGDLDQKGRSYPITILATFDYAGNGIIFDHSGKIRLKYNQKSGVVLDRQIGPVSHWKWHAFSDPLELKHVMTDIHLNDPVITKLGNKGDIENNKIRDDDMLALELDNYIKNTNKLTSQEPIYPYQIKTKAFKINDQFSLRIMDQATIHIIFREASKQLKFNVGMILDSNDIKDIETVEVGQILNSMEQYPPKSHSIAKLQSKVAKAQHREQAHAERQRLLQPALDRGGAGADALL